MKNHFYDYFDTIVHRCCTADEIKRIWAQRFIETYNLKIEYMTLYNIRRKEESYLFGSRKPYGEFIYEELCQRIYNNLIYIAAVDNFTEMYSLDQFVSLSLDIEIQTEMDFQYIDNDIVSRIKSEKSNGDSVYIISDFYTGAEIIKKYLAYHGIEELFDGVYISCDSGYNKHTGTLYEYVLKQTGLKSEDCTMTGDNRHSDYEMALKYGIKAEYTGYKTDGHSAVAELKANMHRIERDIKKRYGNYANYGFAMYLFTDRLYKALKAENYKNVYFLSREGEKMKQLFERYMELNACRDIGTDYLYVSRKSTFIPTLKALNKEDFEVIFREFPNMRIRDFLENLNFKPLEVERLKHETAMDFDKIIPGFSFSDEFRELKNNDVFIDMYEAKRNEQKILFGKYMQKIDNGADRLAIVDVGWKGTIQDNIFNYFDKKLRIDGFYIGILSGGNTEVNNYKHGLLFSNLPEESYMYDEMRWNHSWYERLLYASHPSTDEYVELNGKVEPVFKSFESERKTYEAIRPIQVAVEECFDKVCGVFKSIKCPAELVKEVFAEIHIKALFKEKSSFIKLQSRLCSDQFENFGCNVTQAEVEKERFSLRNMWNKRSKICYAIRNFGKTNETGTICRVFQIRKLYVPLQIVNRYVYHIRMKKLIRSR